MNYIVSLTFGIGLLFTARPWQFLIEGLQSEETDVAENNRIEVHHRGNAIESTRTRNGHYSTITVTVRAFNCVFNLDLRLNTFLFTADYVEKYFDKDGEVIHKIGETDNCFYLGAVRDEAFSPAAVSTCAGIFGYFTVGNVTYQIESNSDRLSGPHRVYRSPTDPEIDYRCGQDNQFENEVNPSNHAQRLKRSFNWPQDLDKENKILELYVAVDHSLFLKLGRDVSISMQRIKTIINAANAGFQTIGIYLVLVGTEVWNTRDMITFELSSTSNTLDSWANYRKQRINPTTYNDHGMLFTNYTFNNGITIGYSYVAATCANEYSASFISDVDAFLSTIGTRVDQQIGLNFGLEYDETINPCPCSDPSGKCIMSSAISSASPASFTWSQCSTDQFNVAFQEGRDLCMYNIPEIIAPNTGYCGNGIVESGEQCDCGNSPIQQCNRACCDPNTCQLIAPANCAYGRCCDVNTCQILPCGTTCRAASSTSCDLAEFCDGAGSLCPNDTYVPDGTACAVSGVSSYCYQGQCRNYQSQCELIWGPGTRMSNDSCYDLNTAGDFYGNCGTNWLPNTSYIQCTASDVKCGLLHCQDFTRTLYTYKNYLTIGQSTTRSGETCHSVVFDFGLATQSPGLVPNGAQCGTGMMCVNQKCVGISSILTVNCYPACQATQVCNNIGQCQGAPSTCNQIQTTTASITTTTTPSLSSSTSTSVIPTTTISFTSTTSDMDLCLNVLCQNSGSCSNGVCACAAGYTGVNCEFAPFVTTTTISLASSTSDMDLCLNVLCQNGGSCGNGVCACAAGYTGVNCEFVLVTKSPPLEEAKFLDIDKRKGPVAGGSQLKFLGSNLDILPVIGVYFNGSDYNLNVIFAYLLNGSSSSDSFVVVTPEANDSYIGHSLSMSVLFEGGIIRNLPKNFNFQFLANPEIIDIQPRTIPIAGGVRLTIEGSNFDSVYITKMFVTFVTIYFNQTISQEFWQTICNSFETTSTQMICRLPIFILPKEIDSDLSSHSNQSSINFRRKRENNRIEFSGVKSRYSFLKYVLSDASSESINTMAVLKRRRRDSPAALYAAGDSVVRLYLGFYFDNYQKYENISRSLPNVNLKFTLNLPVIEYGGELSYTEDPITIRGTKLQICSKEDYAITIGNVTCEKLSSFSDNGIQVRLPSKKPNIANPLDGRDCFALMVAVANLTNKAFCIRYSEPVATWVIVVSAVCGTFLFIIIIVFIICLVMHCKRQRKRRPEGSETEPGPLGEHGATGTGSGLTAGQLTASIINRRRRIGNNEDDDMALNALDREAGNGHGYLQLYDDNNGYSNYIGNSDKPGEQSHVYHHNLDDQSDKGSDSAFAISQKTANNQFSNLEYMTNEDPMCYDNCNTTSGKFTGQAEEYYGKVTKNGIGQTREQLYSNSPARETLFAKNTYDSGKTILEQRNSEV